MTVVAQAKIIFARLCVYIGMTLLIIQVVLKFRKPDRRATGSFPAVKHALQYADVCIEANDNMSV